MTDNNEIAGHDVINRSSL